MRDLLVRTAENSERFDIIICHILNYFIKQKKLVYLNQEGCSFYGIITPEIIQDKHTAKERRMISSSVVANLACDKEFFHNIITMYKENDNPEDKKVNFISCLLKDL
ncbi:MAG: hypothetical protein LBH96_00825 [Candidatus Peribacteria bacterium]|nr:hypothetical protein [Candidatus Peribacteria bacterium]